jgi:hypothetical protein
MTTLSKSKEHNALYDLGMAAMTQEPIKLELSHLFADGLYGRIITMPANTLVMTCVHKVENITTVVTGKCEVVRPDGTRETIIAPAFFVTPANTERAVYVIEESTWITVHASNAKTVQEAEQQIADYPDFFKDYLKQLESQQQDKIEVMP